MLSVHTVLLLALLALFAPSRAALRPISHDCTAHTPIFTLPNPSDDANCLPLLRNPPATNPDRFARCLTQTCYLFIQEAPFIILPPTMMGQQTAENLDQFQTPFPCGQPETLHPQLRGIAFELHHLTSSKDSLCVWAGPIANCTFNALVDFIDVMAKQKPPYHFAITGLLLETQQRHCNHHPSAPFVDNNMVIVGRSADEHSESKGPLYTLVRPFRWSTWGIFAGSAVIFLLACFYIALRFHVLPGRSVVSAFYILAGEREHAMATERVWAKVVRKKNARRRGRWRNSPPSRLRSSTTATPVPQSEREPLMRSSVIATKYGLALTLFTASLVALGAIFALFYEVAVVNFLFQQRTMELDKRVRSLSSEELKSYSVLKNSALEDVWEDTVNPDRSKYEEIPWKRCADGVECIDWVATHGNSVDYDVTFDILAKYLLGNNPEYRGLTLFRTKDVLYQFSAGWLYSTAVNSDFRKKVDGQLVGLRRSGEIQKIIDDATGNFVPEQSQTPSIGPLIVVIPLAIFVLPPLIASILVATCWPSHNEESQVERHRDAAEEQAIDIDDSKGAVAEHDSDESSNNGPVGDGEV